ncbi:Eop3 protein [Paracidovorax avenae ATCC 19860]|uniref:Eop3 protein n=2 Tax=Paracidovorax avenae TaxID=80867 RepID=F0Q2E2_PARA1|nr:hypothetical protein [Paracidovorax avenae]ADX46590.1 Eop3 protein [Paracidovorax avenae ATCC 19860]
MKKWFKSSHSSSSSSSSAAYSRAGVDPMALSAGNGSKVSVSTPTRRHQLGLLQDLPRRQVQVHSQVLRNMEIGQMANDVVDGVMQSGSGCQAVDIAGTGGESWARRKLGYDRAPRGNMESQLERVKHSQGGNCPEHASATTAVLLRLGRQGNATELNAPVVRVWEGQRTLNTTYTMIGDPRVPGWGERNTVVIDPWPVVPATMTLSEARMQDARTGSWTPYQPSEGRMVDTFAPGSSEWDRMAENFEQIQPMSSAEVASQLPRSSAMRRAGAEPFGDRLAMHALREDAELIFDARVSTDPATVYTDGERAVRFDEVSQRTADRLARGVEALGRFA